MDDVKEVVTASSGVCVFVSVCVFMCSLCLCAKENNMK